ncbi:hypothetical protein A3H10_00070 [Candidatus Uhrbacteria bacterium RIFCSPLOWO2_12_FULL_46_10]|uniref:FtsK domain-containing protein n=1 Tax=Candidatus Uhrbacteria bacterium RIFCSPLOWO2_01_FULL_47_25 TaxID=1802402 RepID=A0A1F7UTF0_9BACT|nr:MAG: Cell division FtsK/SpoIIIE [Parcubacteria group bacterium GW2011_GWA2_46_9]OGL60457.1 MAG: hypothetical protein A2752_05155 [Candidatus Uhrbacteria bacterium RIFCSPHIGHO2_01_FULL_46_23]OGL67854.1 MAG: hypothetical protein A3D60_01300 [Candidatus Uhrbacteria bacterium RIFCSPHIGHO2_02_FULL_47_29]OGL76535.1 MAG: hypothetical protein A3E96_00670 [Candidatus Uhrbacteria bacterium RIFCSPHIGHO2_12_FULL_46_13]OGL81529.1 MAG: hypothetical protein A2936_01670 [Candidatus Uhrbacteria bacterium RIF
MSNGVKKQDHGGSVRARGRHFSPGTAEGLIVIGLLVLAGVSALSLLELAGPFGRFLNQALEIMFGWGAWLAPLYFLVIAAMRLQKTPRRGIITLGFSFFVLSALALLDLFVPLDATKGLSVGGAGGGYLGLFLRYPLETVFGYWVAWLLLVALLISSLMIILDTPLEYWISSCLKILSWLKRLIVDFWRGFFARLTEREAGSHKTETPPAFVSNSILDIPSDTNTQERPLQGSTSSEALPMAGVDSFRWRGSSTISRYKPIVIDLPLSLLENNHSKPTSGDIKENKLLIQKTLESFGIPVEMAEVNVGPTVTQYTLKPEDGVKLSAITALNNDLALALASHPIRIEAPIPGRSLVGIEVPNQSVAIVHLREILESEEFQKRHSNLMLALGKDVSGRSWVVDLEKMPHLLVAGATGSGKSVALNSIILSLLYQNNPSDLKFIIIDPKRVEFPDYQHIPHLLTPVITEVPATVNALKWLIKEMDRRFSLLASFGSRNIQSYNQQSTEKLPYIIVIIDELADLMVAAASEVEGAIIRLAQMARAVGIHLVLATQRPSVDVITGLIKANITARVAFSVASLMDSRTILDTGGAEKLIGRGDMLFISAEITRPKRLQGALVGDEEIARVVEYLKSRATPEYVDEVTTKQAVSVWGGGGYDDDDPLLGEAEAVVVQAGKASSSLLQRRLKVGYARAARLIDLLEAKGVVGPGDGAKPRDVLISRVENDILDNNTDENIDEENNGIQEQDET